MTVSPDAELDYGVDARIYGGIVTITDGEVEEVNRLDDRYRERDEKKEKGGEKRCKDREQGG